MRSKATEAGASRLLKSRRIFKEGDLVQIDLDSQDKEGIIELLNDFGWDAIFEVIEVQEPLSDYGSGCPQIIFISHDAEIGIIQEQASNFILAQNPVAA